MKKVLLMMVTLACITTAKATGRRTLLGNEAYDYPYLTLQANDGSLTSLSVESLTITISNGELVVTNGDGTQTFPLASLNKMFFAETAETTGISEAIETDETVCVYSLNGISLGTYPSMRAARSALRPGFYIMKTSSKTIKLSVK